MVIREATADDVPSIVSLLRTSLGEKLLPKSEAYWKWKHEQNPFGPSAVLLALENGEAVGVRAFMRWQWTDRERTYNAVRAVDTATHPRYHGRGIFKTLTLQLVTNMRGEGVDFIFNTPNRQSMPGYLKMGWQVAGKLPASVEVRPVAILQSVLAKASGPGALEKMGDPGCFDHSGLQDLLSRGSVIKTAVTPGYLKWRYSDVPGIKYDWLMLEEGSQLKGVAFFRFKQGKFGTELRIADEFYSDRRSWLELRNGLDSLARQRGVTFISAAGSERRALAIPVKGPIVTINRLKDNVAGLMNFTSWQPSIGDMELF